MDCKTQGEKSKPYVDVQYRDQPPQFAHLLCWDTGLFDELRKTVLKRATFKFAVPKKAGGKPYITAIVNDGDAPNSHLTQDDMQVSA